MEPICTEHESKSWSESTDEDLLDHILAGRQEAYNLLIGRYQERIFRYAFYLMHSRDEAEDVTQETFVRAYLNLSKFRREASFHTWLYRIAANVAFQLMRQTGRHRRIKERLAVVQLQDEETRFAPSPEQEAMQTELQMAVLEAMQKLRLKHRQVLVLKEINGLEVTEVARICRVPEGTVKSRLNRARLELKKELSRISKTGGACL